MVPSSRDKDLPVVFVTTPHLLPVIYEDAQRISRHFKDYEDNPNVQVDARLAPALWLAFFKLRNFCRINRISQYWQQSLESSSGIYSFIDYYSTIHSGSTRKEILKAPFRYAVKESPAISGLVETIDDPKNTVQVRVDVIPDTTSDKTVMEMLYKERSPMQNSLVSIVIILSESPEIFEKWEGVERVLVLPQSETVQDDVFLSRIHDFLRSRLFCFYRIASPQTYNPKEMYDKINNFRSKLIKPIEYPASTMLHATDLANLCLLLFREAVELSDFCAQEGSSPVFNNQLFGWKAAARVKDISLKDHLVERVILPGHRPLNLLGSNDSGEFNRSEQWPNTTTTVNIIAIPHLLQSEKDFASFDEEQPPVDEIFERQFKTLESIVDDVVLESHRQRMEHSSFQFQHFYCSLPLVRSVELQAFLAHITVMMRTHQVDSSLSRFQLGGRISESRALAWALAVYHRRLVLGGIGMEVSEFWTNPNAALTGDTPEEIALKYSKGNKTFVHPLERHTRLKKMLEEKTTGSMSSSSNLYGYLSALSAYLK